MSFIRQTIVTSYYNCNGYMLQGPVKFIYPKEGADHFLCHYMISMSCDKWMVFNWNLVIEISNVSVVYGFFESTFQNELNKCSDEPERLGAIFTRYVSHPSWLIKELKAEFTLRWVLKMASDLVLCTFCAFTRSSVFRFQCLVSWNFQFEILKGLALELQEMCTASKSEFHSNVVFRKEDCTFMWSTVKTSQSPSTLLPNTSTTLRWAPTRVFQLMLRNYCHTIMGKSSYELLCYSDTLSTMHWVYWLKYSVIWDSHTRKVVLLGFNQSWVSLH